MPQHGTPAADHITTCISELTSWPLIVRIAGTESKFRLLHGAGLGGRERGKNEQGCRCKSSRDVSQTQVDEKQQMSLTRERFGTRY